MVGERQTGVNAGNVLCKYLVRATIDGDASVTAHWLNSRAILRFSKFSDTVELSIDETRQFWGSPVFSGGGVLSRNWAWGGPEALTPVIVETTSFYQMDGKSGPDSVRSIFQCN
jgi:hypothetical protein